MGCSTSTAVTRIYPGGEVGIDSTASFHDMYILGTKLGRGTFAQVRIAQEIDAHGLQPGDKAVKMLDVREHGQLALNEVGVWKQLSQHSNVVQLHEVFLSSQICYIVMEKCDDTLHSHMRSLKNLHERSVGAMFVQMLAGLAHVHSAKIVHRDVKPTNFFVGGRDGNTVKLGDFGLAVCIDPHQNLTKSVGTAPFMSPEMLQGLSYDAKADVWSFGVLVYTLLFGEFPYMPHTSTSKAMKEAITVGLSPTFMPDGDGSAKDWRSESAVKFVKALLKRNPANRPSAEEALKLRYMARIGMDRHSPWVELPSLQPMLDSAFQCGAFDEWDIRNSTRLDVKLNRLQIEHHGEALPDMMSAEERRLSQESIAKRKIEYRPRTSRESDVGSASDKSSIFASLDILEHVVDNFIKRCSTYDFDVSRVPGSDSNVSKRLSVGSGDTWAVRVNPKTDDGCKKSHGSSRRWTKQITSLVPRVFTRR